MRRYSLLLATAALAALATTPAAKAAFIDFVALPGGHANTVTLGANTVITGVDVGIASIVGEGTPTGNGSGPSVSDVRLDFTTGAYMGFDTAGTRMYGPGGTLTISDSAGTLFAGEFTGTTELIAEAGGLFKIVVAGFAGQVNAGLDNFYGLSTGSTSAGTLSLNFSAVGDFGLNFLSGDISIDPNPLGPPAGAPEPASLALFALGLPIAVIVRRRRAAKASA